MIKAPAGGLVSPVNGQFYEGGEFVPDTGLFCGKKGAKRKDKLEAASARGRYFDLGGSKLYEIRECGAVVLADSASHATAYAKTIFTASYYGHLEATQV